MNKIIKVEDAINHIDLLVDLILVGNNNNGYELFLDNGISLKYKSLNEVNTKYSNKYLIGITNVNNGKLSIKLYGQTFGNYDWAKNGLNEVLNQIKLNNDSQLVIFDEMIFEKLLSFGIIQNYYDLGVEN